MRSRSHWLRRCRLLIALAEMNNQLKGQKISPRHHVPSAPIAEPFHHMLDPFQMQRQRVSRAEFELSQNTRELANLSSEIA